MTAKEQLRQIKCLETQVKNLELEIEDIRNRMNGCKAISYEEKPGSSSRNTKSPQEIYYPLLEKSENELKTQMMKFIKCRADVLNVINKIKDANCMNLLYKRYFLYKSWEKISVEMHYSYRGVLNLHGRALKEFDKVSRI